MFGQFFRDLFGIRSESPTSPAVNPATGLPMISGTAGLDAGGNPYGTDLTSSSFDDHSFGGSSFGDSGFGSDW
ncbi:MAG: hypothetical protein RBT67_02410 [Thauera sp.]|jgi:hypothetical protein|nr:hypothetical protein [Thauera sp.]